MYWLTGFDTQVAFHNLVYVRVLQCIGLPLFFIPLNTIAYRNLPPGKSNNASAMMNLMRNLGGGIGISIAATLLVRRGQMHQDRLSTRASHGFQPFVHFMNSTGGFTQRNIYGFYRTIQIQSTMLSYLDVFKIFTYGTLVVVALVLTIRKVKPGTKAVMGH
jgi:DHA2 family multidrug resistance protein